MAQSITRTTNGCATAITRKDWKAFWSLLKRAIKGTHVHVSRHRLSQYLGEFEFRWNLRHDPAAMFPLLLKRLAT